MTPNDRNHMQLILSSPFSRTTLCMPPLGPIEQSPKAAQIDRIPNLVVGHPHAVLQPLQTATALASSGRGVPVQGLADEADINSEDGEVVARGLLDMALEKTHAMGGTHMVRVIYSALKKYPGPCSSAARQNVVRSLQVSSSACSDCGIADAVARGLSVGPA